MVGRDLGQEIGACPRCGREILRSEKIVAEKMPSQAGVRTFESVGSVYYHDDSVHCAVPVDGDSYVMDCRVAPQALQHTPSG